MIAPKNVTHASRYAHKAVEPDPSPPAMGYRKVFAFAYSGWVFDLYDLLLLGFLITSTTLVSDLELSTYEVSVLLGAALGATAVGGFASGSLSDRYGRRPLLIATILVYSAGTLACGFAVDFWTMLLARVVTGLGLGGEWAVAHAIMGEVVPPAKRGRYGAYLQSGSAIARFLATLVGFSVAPVIGWRGALIASALPAVMVVFIRRSMPESPVWLSQAAELRERPHMGARLAVMLNPAYRRVTLVATTLTTLNTAAYWFKTIWLPVYFHEALGLSMARASMLLFADQFGSLVGYMTFGWLSDRWGRRPAFTLYACIKAAGIVLLTLTWGNDRSWAWMLGTMVVLGFGEGNWGCIGPLLSELFPTRLRGFALGAIYNSARAVQFAVPVIVAWFTARWGMASGIALSAPLAVLAGMTVWLLPETRGTRLDEVSQKAPETSGARITTVADEQGNIATN